MSDDLSANYKGAFGKRIGYGKKPALIMVDFVEAYFDKSCGLGSRHVYLTHVRYNSAAESRDETRVR